MGANISDLFSTIHPWPVLCLLRVHTGNNYFRRRRRHPSLWCIDTRRRLRARGGQRRLRARLRLLRVRRHDGFLLLPIPSQGQHLVGLRLWRIDASGGVACRRGGGGGGSRTECRKTALDALVLLDDPPPLVFLLLEDGVEVILDSGEETLESGRGEQGSAAGGAREGRQVE